MGYFRHYRTDQNASGLFKFTLSISETDLFIASYPQIEKDIIEKKIYQIRRQLKSFIAGHPEFETTLAPLTYKDPCPPIVKKMLDASEIAGVGPMAAVAGAISEELGCYLWPELTTELLIENGGDLFIAGSQPRKVGIHAGSSPLSEKIGIIVEPKGGYIGVATSAGKVGPSLSFGIADAVTIISEIPALADAVATAAGNIVRDKSHIKKAVDFALTIPKVMGAVAIFDDQVAIAGMINIFAWKK